MNEFSALDHRYMAACLRYARRHEGLTGTNPSVGTLLVANGCIVGRGITAHGGRPHAESIAIAQAGEKTRGATAYVSLEPCAHHGATPPCAQALIDAGVARVVTAWIDPDTRVDGKGHEMLRNAGIVVETGLCGERAAQDLGGYLSRKQRNRPHVTLKLANSKDGKLGLAGQEVPITGPLARAYVHRMRAANDAILVGRGTVEADDPELTCRLPGLLQRSPKRFVLDTHASSSAGAKIFNDNSGISTTVVTLNQEFAKLKFSSHVEVMVAEQHQGRLALPEVLEDMAGLGISTLMVEGGAEVAQSFLDFDLVDSLALFTSSTEVGTEGIQSPIVIDTVSDAFSKSRELAFGNDKLNLFHRKN